MSRTSILNGVVPKVPKRMADATLSQNTPVSGTKYEVLNTSNVEIVSIAVWVTWTVQPDPLEIHLTVDGQTWLYSQTNPVSTTKYIPTNTVAFANGSMSTTENTPTQTAHLDIKGRNVKIEVETTGGTVSNISARIKYKKW